MATAIIGGANDFMIFSLLFYGKQYGFALGALAHVVSAVNVFTGIVDNVGIGTYNVISFFGLWLHIAFIVAGVLSARGNENPEESCEAPRHPLQHITIPPRDIIKMLLFSYSGSTVITLILSYYVADK